MTKTPLLLLALAAAPVLAAGPDDTMTALAKNAGCLTCHQVEPGERIHRPLLLATGVLLGEAHGLDTESAFGAEVGVMSSSVPTQTGHNVSSFHSFFATPVHDADSTTCEPTFGL